MKYSHISAVRKDVTYTACFLSLAQPVVGVAKMEGLWMQEHVCVTVRVDSVGLTVKVSALRENRQNCSASEIS